MSIMSAALQRRYLIKRLAHPNRSVVNAVLSLQGAEMGAVGATLTLRETSALLTHLKAAIRLARWDAQPSKRKRG